MDFEIIQLIAGAGIGAFAFGFKKLLDQWLAGRNKELRAQFSHSNFETVVVAADADESRVADKVREAVQFEADIGRILQGSFATGTLVKSGRGTGVDFVVLVDGKKIGVEAKLNADRLDVGAFYRYIRAASDLDKVIVVSPRVFSERVLAASAELRKSGQIELLTVPSVDQMQPLLEKALASGPRASDA